MKPALTTSSKRPQTYLVTGGAGFIGSHLCEKLLADGARVLIIDNFDPFYPRESKEENLTLLTGNCTLLEKSILDLDPILDFASEQIDAIVHLAAKAGVRPSLEDPAAYMRTNIEGTVRILEFARKRGIQTVIFGSSSSVYGNRSKVPFSERDPVEVPFSPYAATKRAGELICRAYCELYGLRIAALRFFTVYGPRQRPDLAIRKFAELISQGKAIPVFGNGTTERDYTYVSDIVDGICRAVHWTSKQEPKTFDVFNLGGSNPVSLSRLIQLISTHLKRPALLNSQPAQLGDVERTYADTKHSETELGYRSKVDIDTGIEQFVKWLNKTRSTKKKAA